MKPEKIRASTITFTLHIHLLTQYKYVLLYIHFTSLHCTGKYELNKLTSLPMYGFIAHLVGHRTGIAEVTGSNPVEALIFSGFNLSNCLKDHTQPKCIACKHCTGAIFCNTDKTFFPIVFDHRTVSLQSAETGCCRWLLDVL